MAPGGWGAAAGAGVGGGSADHLTLPRCAEDPRYGKKKNKVALEDKFPFVFIKNKGVFLLHHGVVWVFRFWTYVFLF